MGLVKNVVWDSEEYHELRRRGWKRTGFYRAIPSFGFHPITYLEEPMTKTKVKVNKCLNCDHKLVKCDKRAEFEFGGRKYEWRIEERCTKCDYRVGTLVSGQVQAGDKSACGSGDGVLDGGDSGGVQGVVRGADDGHVNASAE
jgi:hypothetical protein